MKKDDKSKYIAPAASIGAGLAAYALFRKPNYSKIPEIAAAQKASKGKVTSLISPEAMGADYNVDALLNPSVKSKIYNWFNNAGIKHVNADEIKKKTFIEGAVYDDVSMGHKTWDPSKVTADIKYNADKDIFRDLLQEKYKFANSPEFKGVTPSAELLSKVLKKSPKTKEHIYNALKDKDVFIKIKSGEGFGTGFQGGPKDILTASKDKTDDLIKNYKNYIVQPKVEHVDEYRIHTFLQNGEVNFGEGHSKYKGVTGKSFDVKKLRPDIAESLGAAMSGFAKKHQDKNMVLGVDLFETKDGKFIINEINDNSGSFRGHTGSKKTPNRPLFPYLSGGDVLESIKTRSNEMNLRTTIPFAASPYANYKALTGRMAQPEAMLKSVGVAGVTGVGISTARYVKGKNE